MPKVRGRQGDRGAALFLMGAAIAVLSLFFGVALQLEMLYVDRSYLEGIADEAAILGAKYLPYQQKAKAAAANYLYRVSNNGTRFNPKDTTVETTSSSLQVTIALKSTPSLMKGTANLQNLSSTTTAVVTPKNLVIFLDNSAYLSPPIRADKGWGPLRNTQWPAAHFFKEHFQDDPLVNPRVLTQQCFNPIFSPLKEAAIRFYDHHAAFHLHQVGVLAGPNEAGTIDQIRAMQVGIGRGNFAFNRSEYSADDFCLAAAEAEMHDANVPHHGYDFPAPASGLAGSDSYHARLVDRGARFLLPSRAPLVTVRKALWSRSVRKPATQTLDIKQALIRVGHELLGAQTVPGRISLYENVASVGVFLLGDFPHQNGLRFTSHGSGVTSPVVTRAMEEAFQSLNRKAERAGRVLQFYFAVTKHFGNYGAIPGCINQADYSNVAYPCRAFMDDSRGFEKYIKKQSKFWRHLKLIFFRVPDRGSLAQDFVYHLIRADRSVLLTRRAPEA